MHQEHPAGQQHDAVERDIALRQQVPEHVWIVRGGGRGCDHAEPEESAEAQQQNGRVETEPGPLDANGGCANDRQHRGEDERVESEEESIADRRERIDAEQPVGGVQHVAYAIAAERGREQPPGAPCGRIGRVSRGDSGQDGRDDRRGRIRVQGEDLVGSGSLTVDEGQQDRRDDVDEQRHGDASGPAGNERLAPLLAVDLFRSVRHVLRRIQPAPRILVDPPHIARVRPAASVTDCRKPQARP